MIQNERVYVCREFVLCTLDLGWKTVELAMSKKVLGVFSSLDKRGKHCSVNTTPDEITYFKIQCEHTSSHFLPWNCINLGKTVIFVSGAKHQKDVET